MVGLIVGVGVGVSVGVGVCVGVLVGVKVGVRVCVGVEVIVGVGVTVGPGWNQPNELKATNSPVIATIKAATWARMPGRLVKKDLALPAFFFLGSVGSSSLSGF